MVQDCSYNNNNNTFKKLYTFYLVRTLPSINVGLFGRKIVLDLWQFVKTFNFHCCSCYSFYKRPGISVIVTLRVYDIRFYKYMIYWFTDLKY